MVGEARESFVLADHGHALEYTEKDLFKGSHLLPSTLQNCNDVFWRIAFHFDKQEPIFASLDTMVAAIIRPYHL